MGFVAAAILGPVAVEHFAVLARLRHADDVALAAHRRKVADDDQIIGRVLRIADIANDAGIPVIGVDPAEAGPLVVLLPQAGFGPVKMVERLYIGMQLAVLFILEQMPVQALRFVPLDELAELAAHEQQFFAGVAQGEAEEAAQSGELLPVVARHLVQQRELAMHHLVMRQRQHEVFRVHVHHRERHQIVRTLAEQRVDLHVAEHVVHPAHVPFVVETEAALMGRPGHAGPGRRFLGDHQRRRMSGENRRVQLAQKVDRFQVLAAAMLVGPPVAGSAGEIQIQQVGDCVHPQPVQVIDIKPKHRVGNQKTADFRATQVKVERAPFEVFRLQLVLRLKQVFPVEAGQAVVVLAKMPRHPVQQHAQSPFVGPVDEVHEILRRAVATGHRVVTGLLVAPGHVERMLCHRQQLQMGVAHLHRVVDQRMRQFPVVQERAVRTAPPGAQMHFVNVERPRIDRVFPLSGEPGVVGPLEITGVYHPGRGARPQFGRKSERVGFDADLAGLVLNRIFVKRTGADARHEQSPDARIGDPVHAEAVATPLVEIAFNPDVGRVRRPDREAGAPLAVLL